MCIDCKLFVLIINIGVECIMNSYYIYFMCILGVCDVYELFISKLYLKI